jgi:hypothetical protein
MNNQMYKEIEMKPKSKQSNKDTINFVVDNGLSLEDKEKKIDEQSYLSYLQDILNTYVPVESNVVCALENNKIVFENFPKMKEKGLDFIFQSFVIRISKELRKTITIKFSCSTLNYSKTFSNPSPKLQEKIDQFFS